jgi:hypothetical protein
MTPPMPRRCRLMPWCPRRAKQWVNTKRGLVASCKWHFRVMDRLTRTNRTPEIIAANFPKECYAMVWKRGRTLTVYLTRLFCPLTREAQVYVLAHESVHVWLVQNFGLASSLAFDSIYRRPLHCLGHRSMMAFEVDQLYCQDDEPLSTPTVL